MAVDRELQEQRRQAIIEILADRPAKKQAEIVRALRKQSFKVTPSSVSHDLKAMGVVKAQGAYRLPSREGEESSLGKMTEHIRRVQGAGPYMLVFETDPGTAKAVSMALKATVWVEIKGVLAEDDTIFVATDNVYDTRLLLRRMTRIMGM